MATLISALWPVQGVVAQWTTRLTTDQKIPGSTPGSLELFSVFTVFTVFSLLEQQCYTALFAKTAFIRVSSHGSIVVSIPACHAGDPGSIPGNGVRSSRAGHPRQGSNLRPIA